MSPPTDSATVSLGFTSTNGRPKFDRSPRTQTSDLTDSAIVDDHADQLEHAEDDDDIEDYDDLDLDPDTLVTNSRKDNRRMASDNPTSPIQRSGSIDPAELYTQDRRNSIQVRLEKTGRKGRYILRADDPTIKEVLRKGIEREKGDPNSKKRTRFRDLVFTRQFTTFDRQNPASADSPFFGFFTLFWIAMSLLFCQVAMRNYRDYGSILGRNQVLKTMFTREVFVLGATDGVMCAACFQGYFFQKLIQKGYINWGKSGWILQNLYQTGYILGLIWWTYFRDWPWTHSIFAVLHGLVFLMKQHSYAFYNGYLSSVYQRRALLAAKLAQLEKMEPTLSPPTSPIAATTADPMASGSDLGAINAQSLLTRRHSTGPRTSTDFKREKSDVASIASAIEAGLPLDQEQLQAFEQVIKSEIEDLDKELQGKSQDPKKAYPNNLTLINLADFICLPTLVYELEYPRQETRNWWYILEKTTATFGVLCVMMVISQGFIYPPVLKTVAMKEAGMTMEQRWQEFPFIVSDILFPLLIEQLLTWYLIWECILNVLAELTYFADRSFYGDWWNSVTWDQYARDWNRPVHNFLLRHVYHSTISSFHLSKTAATFVTFLLSALVHEMVMAILFKKIRGYLFWMQLLQMPLVMVSRTSLLKNRTLLGNVVFWFGLFVGPSLITSLYLVI